MGKRPRIRAKTNRNVHGHHKYILYSADTACGMKPIGRVTFRGSEPKVTEGIWTRVVDGEGRHIGYLILTAAQRDANASAQPSPSCISANESKRYASETSQTAGMTEKQREERINLIRRTRFKIVSAEDGAERLTAKIRVWPSLTGDKQDILRVWPREGSGVS